MEMAFEQAAIFLALSAPWRMWGEKGESYSLV